MGQVNEVPELAMHAPAAGLITASPSIALFEPSRVGPAVVYGLKPSPVKVTVVAGAPATRAVAVDRLEAVITGAKAEASPIPSPPSATNEALLPPVPPFVTMTEHCSGPALARTET